MNFNSREWEIIAEDFNFDSYYHKQYDASLKFGLDREAWQGNVPLYLHGVNDINPFLPDKIIRKAENVVTPDPIFSVFDKENLTFAQMIQEIWKRRKEIVQITPGDDNPYEND